MIEICGYRYAENDNEMSDSLFSFPKTCVGYFKIDNGTIVLMDHQKKKCVSIDVDTLEVNKISTESSISKTVCKHQLEKQHLQDVLDGWQLRWMYRGEGRLNIGYYGRIKK